MQVLRLRQDHAKAENRWKVLRERALGCRPAPAALGLHARTSCWHPPQRHPDASLPARCLTAFTSFPTPLPPPPPLHPHCESSIESRFKQQKGGCQRGEQGRALPAVACFSLSSGPAHGNPVSCKPLSSDLTLKDSKLLPSWLQQTLKDSKLFPSWLQQQAALVVAASRAGGRQRIRAPRPSRYTRRR